MQLFVGIDPGASGGIAVVTRDGAVFTTSKMPGTDRDILDVLAPFAHNGPTPAARAVIEKVGVTPQMGVVSAGAFMKNVGKLLMALTAAGIPFDEVTPGTWQRALGCLQPRGADHTVGKKDKNITKSRAQQLFPAITITHAIADSLLIAEFARRRFTGELVSSTVDERRDSENHGKAKRRRRRQVEGF